MHCSRCHAEIEPDAASCGACGAPVGAAGATVSSLPRPAIVTVLAVLQFIGAAILLLAGALLLIAASVSSGGSGLAGPGLSGLLVCGLGALHLTCAIGLWKLRPYGRTIMLGFAWLGLVGIPLGTIISILILLFLFKPGAKALFSGRPAEQLTADERAQIAAVSQGSLLVVVVLVLLVLALIAMVGIVAAIAVPGLLKARTAANEASAIGSLRVINAAQAAYAASCAAGGYAVTLDDLVKAPAGSDQGFIGPDLGVNGVTKGGYRFTLARDAEAGVTDIGTASATCNASTGTPASSYVAQAEPVTPAAGGRYFATDARGFVFQSTSPSANPIAKSPAAVPVQ